MYNIYYVIIYLSLFFYLFIYVYTHMYITDRYIYIIAKNLVISCVNITYTKEVNSLLRRYDCSVEQFSFQVS